MAFCQNCGAELKEEMKFCAACGTPVAVAPAEAPAPVAEPVQAVEAAPVAAPVAVEEAPVAPQPAYEPPVYEEPQPKKKKGKLIALITAGVAVVAAAAVAVVMFVLPMFGKVEYTPYVLYIKDDNLVITGLEGEDFAPFELSEKVVIAENGNVQWDTTKNTLANRVRVAGGTVFYAEANEEGKLGMTLYCRPLDDPEEEAFEIDNAIRNFVVTENGKTVFFLTAEPSKDDETKAAEGGTMYRYEVGDEEAEEIEDDIVGFAISPDGENIIYGNTEQRYYVMYGDEEISLPKKAEMVAYNDDYTILLFNDGKKLVRMENGEEEELCDSVDSIHAANEELTTFFYVVNGETVSHKLSEFLVDDTANAEKPVEPVKPDRPEYPDSDNYRDADGWIDWDAYNAAQEAYNQAYDEYNKKMDAYYDAYNEYQAKLDAIGERESILERAKEETIEVGSCELYYFDGDEAKKIAAGESISRESSQGAKSAMVYTVTAAPTTKPQIKLSEVEGFWELHDAVEEAHRGEQKSYVAVEGTVNELSDVVSSAAITKEGTVYYTVVDEKDGTEGGAATQNLCSRKLQGTSLSTVTVVDQGVEGSFSTAGEDVVYYKALKSDDKTYTTYGDMYVSGTMVATKAKQWAWKYDEEGGIVTLGEVDPTYQFGTLYLYKDGNVKKIRGDVSDYQWTLSGDLVYLDRLGTNNTASLYLYSAQRGDSSVIDGDVQALIPQYGAATER